MFDWILNTPLIWNLDFNSINSMKYIQTSLKKKFTLHIAKLAPVKKIDTNVILMRINFLELNDLGFFCYLSNLGIHNSSFSFCVTKTGNSWSRQFFETFGRCSRMSSSRFCGILAPHFQRGKMKWQCKWSMLQWSSLITVGKFM